jgi:hypothetical protein
MKDFLLQSDVKKWCAASALPLRFEKIARRRRARAEPVPRRSKPLHAVGSIRAASFGDFLSHLIDAVDIPVPAIEPHADRAEFDLLTIFLDHVVIVGCLGEGRST